ncbi:hypothetical protein J6590_030166 [Homalodisca vitripennis]|nr:hypothetical protein J6590_030166 [Homalodisca vitripennis]
MFLSDCMRIWHWDILVFIWPRSSYPIIRTRTMRERRSLQCKTRDGTAEACGGGGSGHRFTGQRSVTLTIPAASARVSVTLIVRARSHALQGQACHPPCTLPRLYPSPSLRYDCSCVVAARLPISRMYQSSSCKFPCLCLGFSEELKELETSHP